VTVFFVRHSRIHVIQTTNNIKPKSIALSHACRYNFTFIVYLLFDSIACSEFLSNIEDYVALEPSESFISRTRSKSLVDETNLVYLLVEHTQNQAP